MYKTTREFRMHSENLAEVRKGLTQVERGHKQAIRQGQPAALSVYRRLHSLMIGILAEASLRKIVTDPNGFNDSERQFIWRNGSQIDRWLTAVEFAYRRHYSVLIHRPLDEQSLGVQDFGRYSVVKTLLTQDLAPVIEDRNKTAHGQWAWHLKSQKDNEFKSDPAAPEPANYTVLWSQSTLIQKISQLVYVLAVSERTFDRDYQRLVSEIYLAQAGLRGSDYGRFAASLRAKPGIPTVRP